MLRVAFPHKTDGVGGHVVTATSALGGAALLGLRLVCDPAMLYNGHMAQSDPQLGSRLLLGCDEGAAELASLMWTSDEAGAASPRVRVKVRVRARVRVRLLE